MSAYTDRVDQDLRKLKQLEHSSGNKVRILSQSGNPVNKIIVALSYTTAPNRNFPTAVQKETQVVINLLSRYPFSEPNATITTPVFHPNVYDSGKICFGTKWLPTEGLDLLVKRIIKIITFDPNILSESSPANSGALSWYRNAKSKHPNSFPTDSADLEKTQQKPKVSWTNVDQAQSEKKIVACPNCKTRLRVTSGKSGNVICPRCSNRFAIHP